MLLIACEWKVTWNGSESDIRHVQKTIIHPQQTEDAVNGGHKYSMASARH
jgi:hypothetical protein